MGTKHKPSLSQSSASSSEDASSQAHTNAQPTMSRWERLRRPSAASSTKRPNFSEASRTSSAHSSTVTSPTTPAFPLPPAAAPSHDMMRTVSDDSYMHILAASAAARRAATEAGAVSDTASLLSFTCSLSKEFDRQRGADARSASAADLHAAAKHAQSTDKKQAWLDTTFHKLSARYRAPKKGAQQGQASTKPVKPHFLDLSSIICPTPAHSDAAATDDDEEAGDRSSSSSSSFTSGVDSSFEAMSGWDNSSADTSVELRTPQNEEDRQLACAYDFTTPRPSQMQRFASATSNTSSTGGLRLPSPPMISPLMPSFGLPGSGASTPGLAPLGVGQYGFPAPPRAATTLDDIGHKPTSLVKITVDAGTDASGPPPVSMRQLRKQKSFDNPAELRRRQKQEWAVGGPAPPGFGGANLTIGIPTPSQYAQHSHGLLSPQHAMSPPSSARTLDDAHHRAYAQVRSGAGGAVHSRVAEMQRPTPMQRGVSHDTAGAVLQRPGLAPRASHGALRDGARSGAAPSRSDLDPASSTGFSSARLARSNYPRPGSDRRMPVALPTTSPMPSPMAGVAPLPPLLPASSRESYGSSVGTESLPPTPHSATFLRGLPFAAGEDGRAKHSPSSPRDVRIPRELHGVPHQGMHAMGGPESMGSALGLVPGRMVRAYSDSPDAFPVHGSATVRGGSRLRGESISSNDSTGDDYGRRYATQMTPRQKVRPEFRREHTSNAVLVSPPKPTSPQGASKHLRPEIPDWAATPTDETIRAGSAASAAITPRSSSLKDLLALANGEGQGERQSLDSDRSDSSLAYTKPSPLIAQTAPTPAASSASITPTNSSNHLVHAAAATPTAPGPASRWSPETSPVKAPASGFLGARQRANSRADEWAANLRKLTARGGNHSAVATADK